MVQDQAVGFAETSDVATAVDLGNKPIGEIAKAKTVLAKHPDRLIHTPLSSFLSFISPNIRTSQKARALAQPTSGGPRNNQATRCRVAGKG